MSNSLTKNSDLKDLKKKFLELTASGFLEAVTLATLNITRGQFIKMYLDDPEFVTAISEARKARAEYWVSKIAQDIDTEFTKDEVPTQRLKFDKLQFLAKADDPERYGNNSKKLDINIDLTQFKLLPPELAVKALSKDPFAPIEADFTEVEQEDELL